MKWKGFRLSRCAKVIFSFLRQIGARFRDSVRRNSPTQHANFPLGIDKLVVGDLIRLGCKLRRSVCQFKITNYADQCVSLMLSHSHVLFSYYLAKSLLLVLHHFTRLGYLVGLVRYVNSKLKIECDEGRYLISN